MGDETRRLVLLQVRRTTVELETSVRGLPGRGDSWASGALHNVPILMRSASTRTLQVWLDALHLASTKPKQGAEGFSAVSLGSRRQPVNALAGLQYAVPHVRRERTIGGRDLLETHRATQMIEEPDAVAEQVGCEMDQNLVAESGL
jgi:hypothetical protein